ncbi:ABC transporter ATP-binding protein [Veillonella intestinalis]|uniref:ABC transporter ATP-binding protein n=1 Tax=Veillonella intestinalis TaxID=2941341 RepID=UPI00203AE6EF|nr:ABC transporter ATP-binding protein [Veillonella intestinalis]
MTILTVNNLSVVHQNRERSKQILENVSFSLKAGACLGILGESGSGKSMTAKAILGILSRDFKITGEALYKKKNLLTMSTLELRSLRGLDIGMIMQNPMTCFDPLYKIGNQIFETFEAHDLFPRGEWQAKAVEILQKMHIREPEDTLNKFPHQLSGGMLQRIMIGVAMAMKPDILICDEPTTAIDSITQYEIIKEFKRIKDSKEVAMIFITHDISVISHLADEIMVLNQGQVADYGTFKDIMANPKDAYTKMLIEQKLAVANRYSQLLHKPVVAEGGASC